MLAGGRAEGVHAGVQPLLGEAGPAALEAAVEDEQDGRADHVAVEVAVFGSGEGAVGDLEQGALVVALLDELAEPAVVVVELGGDGADVGHGAPVGLQEQHGVAELGQAHDGVGDHGVLADDGVGDFGGPGVQAAGQRPLGKGAARRGLAVVVAGRCAVGGGAGDSRDDDLVDEHGVGCTGGSGSPGVAAHLAVVAEGFGGGEESGCGEAEDFLAGAACAARLLGPGRGAGLLLVPGRAAELAGADGAGPAALLDQLVLDQVADGLGDVLRAVEGAVLVVGDEGVQLLVGDHLEHAEDRKDVGAQRGARAVGVAGSPAEVHPGGPGRLLLVVLLALAVVLVVVHACPRAGGSCC